jgi:maltose O-acetyltransferase
MQSARQKMLAGELYDPLDPELVAGRAHARVCPVRIGDFTLFGPAVQIYTPMHPFNAELRRREEFGKAVEIGADVWVGGGAIILPGVRIGPRAVIGAGSVVTRDIPETVFAAGNPCRVIRDIA